MCAKRNVINRGFEAMKAEAKKLGVTILTNPETFIDDDHLDCVWYGGYIGGFEYKGYKLAIEVHGEVVICGIVNGSVSSTITPSLHSPVGYCTKASIQLFE